MNRRTKADQSSSARFYSRFQLICSSFTISNSLQLTVHSLLISLRRYEVVETTEPGVFKGVSDRFNGITIDSTNEPCDDAQFDGVLSSTLSMTCDLELFVILLL